MASDIAPTHKYGLLPTNDIPIRKAAGIKCAVDVIKDKPGIY